MDRKTFYYRRKVLEEDLNVPFDAVELYDWNYAIDTSSQARTPTSAKDNFGGIAWGYAVTDLGWPSVQFTDGAAYDELGRRVSCGGTFSLNLSKEGSTNIGMGGTATGATTTAPAEGYERWLTVFIKYAKKDSDLSYDGYNEPIYFTNSESFQFEIVAGTEYLIDAMPMDPSAAGPAREANKVLLCDVHIKTTGGTTIIAGIHKVSAEPGEIMIPGTYGTGNRRMEWAFTFRGSLKSIAEQGNWRDALTMLAGYYDAHIDGTDDVHPASDIAYTPGSSPIWADLDGGNYGVSTTVDAAIKGIVEDLSRIIAAGMPYPSGASKIGIRATYTSGLNALAATPFELPEAPLQTALENIKERLNSLVFRGGDETIAGTLAPNTSGVLLGTVTNRWDANLQYVNIDTDLTCAGTALFTNTVDITKALASDKVLEVTNSSTGANATAIYANSGGSSGPTIWGGSVSADGVLGSSGSGIGIVGTSTSSTAISGTSTGTTGQAGVLGTNNHVDGFGIDGQSTAGTGVRGQSTTGTGLKGQSTSGTGVAGVSDTSYGVSGESTSSVAIYGTSPIIAIRGVCDGADGAGVYGYASASDGIGVYGHSDAGVGVKGKSLTSTLAAVLGVTEAATYGRGVEGSLVGSVGGIAVYGRADSSSTDGIGVEGLGDGTNSTGVLGRAGHATAIGVQGSNFEHYDKQRIVMAIPMAQGLPNALHWEYDPTLGLWYNTGSLAQLSFHVNDVPSNSKVISIAIAYINTDSNSIEFGVHRNTTTFTAMSPSLAGGSTSNAALFSTTQLLPTAGSPGAAWIYLNPNQNQSVSRFYRDGTPLYCAQELNFWFRGSATATASEHKIYGIYFVVEFYSVSPYWSSYQARVTP